MNVYLDDNFPITKENQRYFDFLVNSLINFEDANRFVVKEMIFESRQGDTIKIERKRNGIEVHLVK